MDEIPIPSMGCHLLNRLPHRFFDLDGASALEIDMVDEARGPGGSLHGGLIATLIDVAGSYAIYADGRRPSSSTSLTVQYLSAARKGPVRAVASILRTAKSVGVAEVRVVDRGAQDRLVATGSVMVTFLDGDSWRRPADPDERAEP